MKSNKNGAKVISIDIDEKNIHAVHAKITKHGLKVLDSFTVETPVGAINDGRIINVKALEQVLSTKLEERRIKKCLMSFSFSSSTFQEREITLPKLSKKELQPMVEYEIQQYLPYDVSRCTVEYIIKETFFKDGQEFHLLNVTAIEKSIVKPYLNLIKRLGFKVNRFDLNTNSVNKLVSLSKKSASSDFSNRQVAIIEFGHASSNILIFKDGEQKLSQSIDFSNSNVVYAMQEVAEFYEKPWLKPLVDNFDFSIIGDDSEMVLNHYDVDNILSLGVNEVLSIFRYYMSRDEYNKVDEIYVYGSLIDLKGVSEKLEQALVIPVKCISELNFSSDLGELDYKNYLHPIGSMIVVDETEDYNFFNAFNRKKSNNLVYILLIVFVTTVILSTHTYFNYIIKELESENKLLEEQANILLSSGYVSDAKDLNDKKASLEELLAYITVYGYTDSLFEVVTKEYLLNVVNQVPEKLYFETWTTTYKETVVTGVTNDYSLLAEFEIALREAGFDYVHIKHITQAVKDPNKYSFEIRFNKGGIINE